MDTSKFNTQHDRFPLLGMVAQFEYRTDCSISFMLGEGPSYQLRVRGRLEVQHPCRGEFAGESSVRIRCYLPSVHLTDDDMAEVVKTAYSVLSIPSGERHQARFAQNANRSYIVQDLQVVAQSAG